MSVVLQKRDVFGSTCQELWVNVYPDPDYPGKVVYGIPVRSARVSHNVARGRGPIYRLHIKRKKK